MTPAGQAGAQEARERHPPLSGPVAALRAAALQAAALAITLGAFGGAMLAGLPGASPWPWVLVHGLLAAVFAGLAGERGARLAMHGLFLPAALVGAGLPVPSGVWLVAAGLIALTSHNALRERVPLFLTSAAARRQLIELLPADRPIRFVDAGCGVGGVVVDVARERPTLACVGLETAWLPWLVARLRCAGSPNRARALRQDLWDYPLGQVDLLYAYLSPVPMERLWAKACAEMRPGSVVVSNTFAVPGATAEVCLPVDDLTGSVLRVYRIPEPR